MASILEGTFQAPPSTGTPELARFETGGSVWSGSSHSVDLDVDAEVPADGVFIELKVAHENQQALYLELVSPSGRATPFFFGFGADISGAAFDVSDAFRGESTLGTWTLRISDGVGVGGSVERFGLQFYPEK